MRSDPWFTRWSLVTRTRHERYLSSGRVVGGVRGEGEGEVS
jgi:hypothetical protein